MKFVRFASINHLSGAYGLVREDGGIDVIRGGLFDPVENTGEVIREGDIIRYLPPVDPPNILALGVNYQDHISETKSALPKTPLLFIKATTALAAHGDSIVLPSIAPDHVDYEAELAVVIGRKARNVTVDEALDCVFGYTCANDVTARDCQAVDGQWARAKSFDTFAPIGPYVVTDLDPSRLHVRMRLNGAIMQDQPASDLIFDVAFLVSFLSQGMTLLPGTVILTGTPGGIGASRTPAVFLRPGDVCEVEIDGIGVLRNVVTG